MAAREGHGFGAYFLPYVGFLLVVEASRRGGADVSAWLFPVKVAVPLGLFAAYYLRGHYPELRGQRLRAVTFVQDVLVGVLGAALWMAPYIAFASLRPEEPEPFDPQQFGPSLAWLALGLRAVGYGLATPLIEELFVRSWLIRYVEVLDQRGDFRKVPIGHYSRVSLAVVVVWFTVTHVPWEWPVAVGWILLTQLWFYHRRSLPAMVVVHASSNLSILAFVTLFSGTFTDADGSLIDLWFFV